MAVSLFVGIWVARYLGPERFGLFSYAQSFVGLFAVIATLGLDTIVVRELVKDEGKTDKILGTALWLKLMGACTVLGILAIAINFTSNDGYTNTLIFIIASATIFQSFNVVDFYFQSKVMSKYVVYANIISLLISSIIKVILILNEAPLISFAWVVLFDSFILASGFIYFFLKNSPKVGSSETFNIAPSGNALGVQHLTFNKSTAVDLLRDSWPLILTGIVISIYMRIDQVMIKQMLDNEAVGQYAAAVSLSEAWYIIPIVITSSLFPAIINARKQSEDLYYARLQKLYDLMLWMAIAIALPMTFLSDWLVELLYGKQYNEAGSVLLIHIWAAVFVFLGVAFNKYLICENFVKKSFYRTLSGAVINIMLNYLLIPKYGIQGAAIATLLSQFMANYAYDIFDKQLHHQFAMKTKAFIPIHLFQENNWRSR